MQCDENAKPLVLPIVGEFRLAAVVLLSCRLGPHHHGEAEERSPLCQLRLPRPRKLAGLAGTPEHVAVPPRRGLVFPARGEVLVLLVASLPKDLLVVPRSFEVIAAFRMAAILTLPRALHGVRKVRLLLVHLVERVHKRLLLTTIPAERGVVHISEVHCFAQGLVRELAALPQGENDLLASCVPQAFVLAFLVGAGGVTPDEPSELRLRRFVQLYPHARVSTHE